MRGFAAVFASVIVSASIAGCGGAPSIPAPPAMAPPAPEPAATPASQPEAEEPEDSGVEAGEPSSLAGMPTGGDTELRLADDVDGLMVQLRAAEMVLLGAGNACDIACRALRSMGRAAGRMCEIASSAEEEHRCEDAKRRYQEARERVRVACRGCPEGPVLDGEPDAG